MKKWNYREYFPLSFKKSNLLSVLLRYPDTGINLPGVYNWDKKGFNSSLTIDYYSQRKLLFFDYVFF